MQFGFFLHTVFFGNDAVYGLEKKSKLEDSSQPKEKDAHEKKQLEGYKDYINFVYLFAFHVYNGVWRREVVAGAVL